MKSKLSICIAAAALLAVLSIPVQFAAQDNQNHKNDRNHHHYKLIDMGTFGGALSGINEPGNYVPAVNPRGQMVGFSANSVPASATNNPAACFGANVTHAFQMNDGVVTDLGSLAGANFCSDGDSINQPGEIEGLSEIDEVDPVLGFNEMRAVIWKHGQIFDLGTLGGKHSWSFGINNRGQVVGLALNAVRDPYSIFDFVIFGSSQGTQTRAFLWQNEVMQDLGTLGGPDAWAGGINQRGQIAGNSYTNSTPNESTGFPTLDPFFWNKGKMQDLGSLGGVVGFVEEMNNRGQIIGGSSTAANPSACYLVPNQSIEFGNPGCDPFFWDGGAMLDLSTSTVGGIPQSADAINDLGEIVGASSFPTQPYDAYLRRNGRAIDLGYLTGDCFSEAWAINLHSQVVGDSFSCGSTFQHAAFLWEHDSIVDLNTLIPADSGLQLVFATAINDRGEIAGNGVPAGVSPGDVFTLGHAFLLIPCDETHPNIDGCDYNMVDTSATTQASAPSVTHGLTPPRQSRPGFPGEFPRLPFGWHLGPWNRALRAQTLALTSQPLASTVEAKCPSGDITDQKNADQLVDLVPRVFPGRCVEEFGKLTGRCAMSLPVAPGCTEMPASMCHLGATAKRPGLVECCGRMACVKISVDLDSVCQ